ncbi:MAG: cytochrome P450 [Gammaproteobacteria bacterium]
MPSTADLVAALPQPATIANPYPLYDRLRPATPAWGYRDYPPGTVPEADDPVTAWVLMKYAEVVAAARDHETFSSRDPLQENSSAPTLMLVNHDNPEHDRLRGLVALAFSRKRILALEAWLRDVVEDMLAALPAGECEAVGALTSMIPARTMLRLFGLPDGDAERCRRWATAFMLSADLAPAAREASNRELFEYFAAQVASATAARRAGAGAGDGLLRALLDAEQDGERLSEDEVVRFCVTLIVAGAETTTFLLANLLHYLATLPGMFEHLAADRARLERFIDEALRHGGPPQRLFRIATRDVTIGTARIAAGDWVALFFGAANHDANVFPDPQRFDMERPNLRQQLSFGYGLHHCLGFALARLEARAMLNAVLDRYCMVEPGPTPSRRQQASLLTCGFDTLHVVFTPRAR